MNHTQIMIGQTYLINEKDDNFTLFLVEEGFHVILNCLK